MQILQSSDNLLCVFTILEEKENTVKMIALHVINLKDKQYYKTYTL